MGRLSLGKTTRPSLAGITARERVFSLLARGREGPIVWVSGPPGSGKTTAVASYLDRARIASLWYQLDEGDADPATFFHYLRLAADEIGSGEEPLPVFAPEYHAALAVFTRRYFQALYARLEVPFAVVFDGYHEVPGSSPWHEVMRDALSELPRGGCAILISRGDPPALFARFRANRAPAVIGEQVSEERITEAMWPRIEGDSAHRSFTSTLHRLRRLLGEDRSLVLYEGRFGLERRFFWVDAWALEHALGEIDAAFRRSRIRLDAQQLENMSGRVLALYKGRPTRW